MKAIILVSSIFYVLGLKVSNKVELVKKDTITPVVTYKLENLEKPGIDARFHHELEQAENATGTDSLTISDS